MNMPISGTAASAKPNPVKPRSSAAASTALSTPRIAIGAGSVDRKLADTSAISSCIATIIAYR
jgi:hypothetical protein